MSIINKFFICNKCFIDNEMKKDNFLFTLSIDNHREFSQNYLEEPKISLHLQKILFRI